MRSSRLRASKRQFRNRNIPRGSVRRSVSVPPPTTRTRRQTTTRSRSLVRHNRVPTIKTRASTPMPRNTNGKILHKVNHRGPPSRHFLNFPNQELQRLAREFGNQHLNLPPSPISGAVGGKGGASWPADLAVNYISIRDDRASAFARRVQNKTIPIKQFHGVHGRTLARVNGLRQGEVGCSASHRRLWAQLAADPAVTHAIIAEDDANLVLDVTQMSYIVTLIAEAKSANVDLIYLSWFQGYRSIPINVSTHLRSVFESYIQLWCIYVTKAGLQKLTRTFPPANNQLNIPIDVAVRNISGTLRSCVAWPPVCWSVGCASDTVNLR